MYSGTSLNSHPFKRTIIFLVGRILKETLTTTIKRTTSIVFCLHKADNHEILKSISFIYLSRLISLKSWLASSTQLFLVHKWHICTGSPNRIRLRLWNSSPQPQSGQNFGPASGSLYRVSTLIRKRQLEEIYCHRCIFIVTLVEFNLLKLFLSPSQGSSFYIWTYSHVLDETTSALKSDFRITKVRTELYGKSAPRYLGPIGENI